MKKLTVLLIGMCALWLLLAACAANDPQTAVQYREALNSGDMVAATLWFVQPIKMS